MEVASWEHSTDGAAASTCAPRTGPTLTPAIRGPALLSSRALMRRADLPLWFSGGALLSLEAERRANESVFPGRWEWDEEQVRLSTRHRTEGEGETQCAHFSLVTQKHGQKAPPWSEQVPRWAARAGARDATEGSADRYQSRYQSRD